MSDTGSVHRPFGDEPDDVTTYRPVSTLAVLGLVGALVSALALVTPWLSGVPWVAAVLSLAGWREVRNNPESKTGGALAVVGLAVSLVAGGALVVRDWRAQTLHAADARPVAERFVELLASDDPVGAIELTKPYATRRPSLELARLYYRSDSDAAEKLAEFREREAVSRLADLGEPPRLMDHSPATRLRGGRLFSSWLYPLPANEREPDSVLSLRLERTAPGLADAKAAWLVSDFKVSPRVD